jgi:hypothetical protein
VNKIYEWAQGFALTAPLLHSRPELGSLVADKLVYEWAQGFALTAPLLHSRPELGSLVADKLVYEWAQGFALSSFTPFTGQSWYP